MTPAMWRSRISIEENPLKTKKLPPIHPGEILLEEFLAPMGISQYRLAKALAVPPEANQRDRSRQAGDHG